MITPTAAARRDRCRDGLPDDLVDKERVGGVKPAAPDVPVEPLELVRLEHELAAEGLGSSTSDRADGWRHRAGSEKFTARLVRGFEESLDLLLRGGGSFGIVTNCAETICHLGG